MPIRQVDRTAWVQGRCMLTRADLERVPPGTSTTQVFNWAGYATGIVNKVLQGMTAR